MTFKKLFAFGLVAVVLVACGDDASSGPVTSSNEDSSLVVKGTMTDSRDGQTYKTVKIGTQTWMAENLNYAYTGVPFKYSGYTSDSTSWCYGEKCPKYGRFYTWAAAMDSVGRWSTNGRGCGFGVACSPTYPVRGACPEGWHLPTKDEFEILFDAVGGDSIAGEMLKSTNGWVAFDDYDYNYNTDAYSFSVLPAGFRNYKGYYSDEGYDTAFWSSTEDDISYAYDMYLSYDVDAANLNTCSKFFGLSVRCVKDL